MGASVDGAACSSTFPAGFNSPNSRSTSSSTFSCVTFPAAVSTKRSGANQHPNRFRNESLLNLRTVSGVPKIGRPSGCLGQKPLVKISCSRYSGLSRSILISSKTTWRSFFTSSESNFGRNTKSAITSNAIGRCSSKTLALKQICSLDVNASSIPPTESISRAIASAERRSVPLKTMCSMKCASPFSSGTSRREPLRTHTPTETERTCVIVSVMTRRKADLPRPPAELEKPTEWKGSQLFRIRTRGLPPRLYQKVTAAFPPGSVSRTRWCNAAAHPRTCPSRAGISRRCRTASSTRGCSPPAD